jgi:LAS seventeen-binding protein 5
MCLPRIQLCQSNKGTFTFKGTFADGHLTDALRNIASDPNADKRVKKKLILVLGSWHNQFSSDPSMTLVAGLYKQCRVVDKRIGQQEVAEMPEERRRVEKEEMRKKEQQEKAAKAQDKQKKKRTPFEFEMVFFL